MLRTAVTRLGQAVSTLIGAAVLVWSMQLLAPGDPARRVLAASGVGNPTREELQATRERLGLDDPAPVRLVAWFADVVGGDLGTSWTSGRPVLVELTDRLPATLRLTTVALVMALVLAVPLAVWAVARARRADDLLPRGLMFAGAAIPGFVLGTVLLDVVVVGRGIGSVLPDGSWSAAILPAVPLAIGAAAVWARVLRTVMLERAGASFVEVARARGASGLRVLLVHLLPGAVPALLTAIGLTVGALLAGAAVVETVFTWPGIGRYLVAAIEARDLPVVQGVVLFGVLAYVVASMLADLAARLVAPDG